MGVLLNTKLTVMFEFKSSIKLNYVYVVCQCGKEQENER